MEKFTGILLAAGYSSRMGAFKPLLPVGGMTALERGIRCLQAAGLDTVVVTGYRHEELAPLIQGLGAEESYNPDFDAGMFTSVLAGLRRAAAANSDGAALMPCDCAAVPVEAVKQLLACAGNRGEYALPTYEGKNGHPLFIPARYYEEILHYTGPGGLKGARELRRDSLLRLPMPYPGTLPDMDTREDYEALCAGLADDGLRALCRGRRFLLVRHGATELHSGKVIMGRYDAHLSEIGREQMRALRDRLPSLSTARLYYSPQRRAADSAALLNETLHLPMVPVEALREISLGAWDGLLIDEVKHRWPMEYARRGEYLMSYKIDADSESFYEVEYRVRQALLRILREDDSPDILILSHAGVIKCLYGLITGIGIDRAFSACRPDKGELTIVTGE